MATLGPVGYGSVVPERDGVTVLWTREPPLPVIDLASLGAVVVRVDPGAMAGAMLAALARGGVVAVVDEEAADGALSLGVDEVLGPEGAASADAIRAAVERARLRATARARRDARLAEELCRSDGEALELLVVAAAHDLETPIAVASLDCEMVTEALGVVVGVADEVARWAIAMVPPPLDDLRRLAAARRSAPPTDELAATTSDLAAALRRATQVVRKMSALAPAEEPAERVCLVESLLKVESLMRGIVERNAAFEVALPPGPCPVSFPRWALLQSIAALLSNAQEAVGARGRKGRIELRLLIQPDTAIVEVADDGVGMTPEVRARAYNPFFTTRRPRALGLGLTIAAARVRRAGGEVLIESESGVGTRVRVFLPTEPPSERRPSSSGQPS